MSIVRAILDSFANDQVAIFTQDFDQVFRQARSIKAVVKETAKVMEHPVETGAVITDHRIINPIEIELSMILQAVDYRDVYRNIKQAYLNATLLIVQTKSDTYFNQMISSLPHEEDPSMYDTIAIALSLKQVLFTSAQYGQPKSPVHAKKSARGTQQPTTPRPSSALNNTANRLLGG